VSRHRQLHASALILVLTVVLPGCAAYRSCGFRGCPGDAEITSEVQTQLEQYPALEAPNLVHARTLNRVVYLYGQVDTDLERQLAELVARQAARGARVVDSIAVSNVGY
jgi:osmotically-inducible protein OsmY